MRVLTTRITLTTAVAGAAALSLGLSGTAHATQARPADTAARSSDAVGVGSDTLQNAADFVLDGTGNGATGGFNEIGNVNRVFNYYSTGDANGRALYDGTCGTAASGPNQICSSTNTGDPNALKTATVILREGNNPVVRPNGSGAGVAALIADSGFNGTTYQGLPNGSISFARMSRLPKSTEEGNCPTTSATCGGLHVYQLATDQLQIAHSATGYNGPAGLSIKQLLAIYQCQSTKFSDVGGTSSDTIHPLLPQTGSGTRDFFLADLQAANAGTAVTPGPCVRIVQEHDPDGIYQDGAPGDVVEPFSAGKISLINSGYFTNGGPAFAKSQLATLTGTPSDSGTAYNSKRGLYFTVRQADLASTTPFEPGSALNIAQTLFDDGNGNSPYISRASEAGAITAAGFTPAYKNCGVNPTSC